MEGEEKGNRIGIAKVGLFGCAEWRGRGAAEFGDFEQRVCKRCSGSPRSGSQIIPAIIFICLFYDFPLS